jgi:hypothetical protein
MYYKSINIISFIQVLYYPSVPSSIFYYRFCFIEFRIYFVYLILLAISESEVCNAFDKV